MITFIAHLRVPPVNATAFEELMTHVAAMTNEHEPGVVHYAFAKSVDDADTYAVIEVYEDQEAVVSHGNTEWVQKSVPKSLSLIDGMPLIRQYVSPNTAPVESRFEDLA